MSTVASQSADSDSGRAKKTAQKAMIASPPATARRVRRDAAGLEAAQPVAGDASVPLPTPFTTPSTTFRSNQSHAERDAR